MEFSFLPIPPRESTCAVQHWTGDLNPWSRSVSLELQLPQPQSPTQMLPPYSIDPRLASPTICWCLFREVNKHNGAREPHVWGADVTLGSAADNQSVDASHRPLEYLSFCYIPSAWTARSLGILLPCHGLEAAGELQLLSETSKWLKLKLWVALSSYPILPKLSF